MQELYTPRNKYIQTKDEISNCPDCDELLVAEKSTIMLYGKSDVDEGQFMSNLSGSHFCHNCPVVVFEQETIEKAISAGLRTNNLLKYGIVGLVDLEAVPEEKAHLELGIDENPIPLIRFLNDEDRISRPQIPHRRESKVGRNAPCPCGSGKKYKKCCM